MSSRHTIQLLSPARDYATAVAAIQAGADSIYIGAPRFGARQAAGNSLEDIRRVVEYARPYGVGVLVTLNTLLTVEEIPEAVQIAWDLYHAGVYALIVQDLRLLEQSLPPIRLHASTQCDNRTAAQVARLRDLGFSRVVLARELSIKEIHEIHQAVPDIELEAFVHGALCVSYSGRCYMSEVLMGRSANRGCCAQMCRMRYDLLDKAGNELTDDAGRPMHQRYVLSLQDLDRSAALGELIAAGVTTFKIEGRLKDTDYVTNVTAYYREKLDKLIGGNGSVYRRDFVPDPLKTFHRGATEYFLHGRKGQMANWETPKSTGEVVGSVVSARGRQVVVRLVEGVTLHNGDGLAIGADGFSVNNAEPSAGGLIRLTLNKIPNPLPQAGASLSRNLDTAFLKTLRSERKVPIDIVLAECEGGYRLTIGGMSAEFPYAHTEAENVERAEQTIRQQLSKLGDTPYIAREIRLKLPTMPFIPVSVLNEWRRNVVQILTREVPKEKDKTERPRVALKESGIGEGQDGAGWPLMTCRYCLLHEMGHCRKEHPLSREPRFLRLQNGTRLELHFHCERCEMSITRA